MADGLTFRFVFQDESQGAPPPEAEPGAASKTRPTPQHEEPPQPRPAPQSFPTPSQPQTEPHQPAQTQDERQSPEPRRTPQRRPAEQPEGEREQRRPRRPAPEGRQEPRQPQAGEAERLISEMVRHLSAVPGIGRSIGLLAHIVEPILQARNRLQQLAERQEQSPAPKTPPVEPRKPAAAPTTTPHQAAPRGEAPPAPRLTPEAPEIIEAQLANPDERFPVKPFETPAPRPAEVVHRVEVAQPEERENPDKQFPVRQFERPEKKESKPEQQPAPRQPKESNKTPDSAGFREAFESFKGIGDSLKDSIWQSINAGKGIPKMEQKTILGSFTNEALRRGYSQKDEVYKAMELAAQISAAKVSSTEKIAQLNESINRHFPVKQPEPRKPSDSSLQQPEPREFKVAAPPSEQAALEKLIAALGPLPQSEKELTATLRPLKDLGYTLTELKQAVRDMRQREGGEGAPTAETAPRKPAEPIEPPAPKPEPRRFPIPTAKGIRTIRPVPPPAASAQPSPLAGATARAPSPVAPAAPAPAPAAAAPIVADAVPAAAEAGGAAAAAGAGALGGPAGIAIAIGLVAAAGTASRTLGALADTAKRVDRSFVQLSERLAPFSQSLAFAQANATARQTLTDMQNARQVGNRLAEFTNARSQIDRNVQRIAAAFSGVALNRLNPVLEVVGTVTQKIADNSDKLEAGLELLLQTLFPLLNITNEILKKVAANTKPNQPNLDPNADIMGIFGGDPNRARVIIEGLDFGTVANPLTPRPVRGRGPKPPKGNAGP